MTHQTDEKHERFVQLGWQLLEHKAHYYIFCNPQIEDYAYDMLEREYDELAKELGEEPTASDMVDFDTSRPACRAVLRKLRGGKLA